ncbi:hypothetical protein AAFF_G00047620 [Aldrovandia affinis]|uniref:Uncharacterized protein n=1 Tax=Aldrovandia affinis TaxID=143900 RepID=A0AAD7S1V3_9TELE|nr:hypothetical protein AAFF_G00047620 [Aldrovandia affinis]
MRKAIVKNEGPPCLLYGRGCRALGVQWSEGEGLGGPGEGHHTTSDPLRGQPKTLMSFRCRLGGAHLQPRVGTRSEGRD